MPTIKDWNDRKVVLVNKRAPGDVIAMTALARDLKRQYPGIELGVSATVSEHVFRNNPYISGINGTTPGVLAVEPDYRAGLRAVKIGAKATYLSDFHRDLLRKYDSVVELLEPRPDLYLDKHEKASRPYSYPYWVVLAGGKWDMTTKIWSAKRYQEVVNQTRKAGINWIQVGSRQDPRAPHIQYELDGPVNLIGQTTVRDLIVLIYHAEGVLCGITQTMLIAQALEKPCVVIAGGRESYHWLAYERENDAWGPLVAQIRTPHRFLHTIGRLDCCAKSGCYTSQVVPAHNDSPFPVGYLCKRPVIDKPEPTLPECMRMITVEQVVSGVLSYTKPHD